MRKFSKRTIAIAVGIVLVASGGVAYAYWSAGGSGTGSATTGTSAPITAVQTSTITALAPGGIAQTLSGNFTNTNSGPVFVGTVTVSIASVTKDAGAVAGTCDLTDYTLANAVMTVNAEVPVGVAQGAWTGATIKFNDKTSTNQDQCKLATVNLAYLIA